MEPKPCLYWALLGLILFTSAVFPLRAETNAVLTTCAEILALDPSKAASSIPVQLEGPVTLYVPHSQLCFIQDKTAGIYIWPSPWPTNISAGDIVRVKGMSGQGAFSPIVQWGTISPTGRKAELTARRVSIEEIRSGAADAQHVEVEGVVCRVEQMDGHLSLWLRRGGSEIPFVLYSSEQPDWNLVDARVVVQGVAGTFYQDRQLSGFGVFAADPRRVQIVRAGRLPFAGQPQPVKALARYSPEGAADHRFLVQGTVTWSEPGRFFLRDASGAIEVRLNDSAAKPAPGDIVQAAGFIASPAEASTLLYSVYQQVGQEAPPAPIEATLSQLDLKSQGNALLLLRGKVLAHWQETNAARITLGDSGGAILTASSSSQVEPMLGAEVAVRGVYTIQQGKAELLLDAAAPVEILKAPPETHRRNKGTVIPILGLSCALSLLLAGLAWRSRRQKAQAQRSASNLASAIDEKEQELASLKKAREALGRDLHDNFLQSVYALGLSLEDSAQIVDREPRKVETRLRNAALEINSLIRDLRNVLSGLESSIIHPNELKAGLKSLALALGTGNSNSILVQIDQAAIDVLTPQQSTEIMHIAREAISNSVKHSGAQRTMVTLRLDKDRIQLAVEDNGSGFNLGAITGTGFGLRNMHRRAEMLGGALTVSSQPAGGTRIVLDIPARKHHLSERESHSITHC